jgi:hypothetical protein
MFSSMFRYRGLLAICAVLVIFQALGASTTPVAAASTVSAPSKDKRHTLGEEDFTWMQAAMGGLQGAVTGGISGAVVGAATGLPLGAAEGFVFGSVGGWLGQMLYNGFFGDATPEATSSLVPKTALD